MRVSGLNGVPMLILFYEEAMKIEHDGVYTLPMVGDVLRADYPGKGVISVELL